VVKLNNKGFGVLETALIIVVIAAVVGVGYYVVRQKHTAEATLSSNSNTAPQAKAPTGTTASVDQLTQQDAKTEASADNTTDASLQQDSTSANTAINSLGGAYNEANY